MGFPREGSVAHSSDLEALNDFLYALHLIDIHRIVRGYKFKQSSQSVRVLRVIDEGGIFSELVVTSGPDRLLQKNNDFRAVEVVLLARTAPKIVESCTVKNRIHRQAHGVECPVMPCRNAFFQLAHADAADSADNACKILINDFI